MSRFDPNIGIRYDEVLSIAADINARIDAQPQETAQITATTVEAPVIDNTFAPIFSRAKHNRVFVTLRWANFGTATDIKNIIVPRGDILSSGDYDNKRFTAKITDGIDDNGRATQLVAGPMDVAFDPLKQYDVIRLVAVGANNSDLAKNPPDLPLYADYPGNVLFSFTTPVAFGAPSDPNASLILVNALDPTTKDYDGYVVLRVYAPLTDGGAAQTWEQADASRVRCVVSRTGTTEVLHGDVRLDGVQLTQVDPTSTPPNRGYVDVTVSGQRPGTAYTWDKNVIWTGGEKNVSGGSAVAFTSAGLVIGAAGLPGLTGVSLTATVDGDIASSTSCSVTLAFTQSTPATALRRLKLFYKKSTTGSYGDDPYTRTLHKDDFHAAGGSYTATWTGIKIKPRVDWNFKVTIVGEGDPTGTAPTRDVTTTLDATALNDPSAPATAQIVTNQLDPSTKEHDALVAFRIYAPLTDGGAVQSFRVAQVDKAWVQLYRVSTGRTNKYGGSLNDAELDQVDSGSTPANRGFVDVEVSLKVADYLWLANIIEGLGERHAAIPGGTVQFKAGGLATAGSGITELTSVSLSLNTSDPYDGKNALLTLNLTQPAAPVALRYCYIETSTDGGSSFQQVGDLLKLKDDVYHSTGAKVVPLRIIKTKRLTSHIFRVTIVAQGGNTRQATLTSTTPDSTSSTPIPGALAAPTVTTNTVDGDPEKNNARIVVTVAPASGTFTANNITAVYVVVVKRDSTGTPDATDKQTLTKALSTAELATSTCTLEFLEVMGQRLRITKVIAANGDQRTETGPLTVDFTAGGVVTGAVGEITVPPPTISVLIIDDSDNKAVVVPVVVTQNGSVITLFKKLILEKRIPATSGTYRFEKEINLRHEDGLYVNSSSTQTFNISCKRKAGQTVGFRARIKAVGGAVSADSSERTDTASTGDILTDTQIPGGTGATLTAPTVYFEAGKGLIIDFDVTGLTFMNTHLYNSVRIATLSETIPTRTITNAPNTASPTTITTSAAHGFSVNQTVVISGVLGNTAVNGTWVVATVPSATTFTIPVAGSGAYTSGGSVGLVGAFLDIPTKTLVASGTTSKKQIHKSGHTVVSITRRKLRDLFGPTAHIAVRYFITNSIGETQSAITDVDLATLSESMSETGLEQEATIPARMYAFGLGQILPGAGFLSSKNAYDGGGAVNTVGRDWWDKPAQGGGGGVRIDTSGTRGLKWLKATHNIEIATNVFTLGGQLCCQIPSRQIIAGETYAFQVLFKMASGTYTLNAFTASLYDEINAADIPGTPISFLSSQNLVLTTTYSVVACVFLVDTAYVQGGGRQWLRLQFGENPPQIMYADNASLVNRAQSIPWCPSPADSDVAVDVTVTGDTGAGGVGSTGGGGNGSGGSCFPAGTRVRTPYGEKPIETIVVGDSVLAVTPQDDVCTVHVKKVFRSQSDVVVLKAESRTLYTTDEHPIMTGTDSFTCAGKLKAGDKIISSQGPRLVPLQISSIARCADVIDVYNMSVESPHTFIADGFVVHNKINPGEGGGIVY